MDNKISIEKIKESVSIIDYAQSLGMSITKKGGYLFLKEHDSCCIYPNNTFTRYSAINENNKYVGGSVLDFIMHFENCNFKEALIKANKYYTDNNCQIITTLYETGKQEYYGNNDNSINKSLVLPKKIITTTVFIFI
ncbi:MAG: hypothetical protein WBO70_02015 [Erysipelotrichaceae bacterium]